jgi:DHA2 family multidrug resistance protein
MAMWGMGIMVGPILGPTLGGYLTEFYNWRWVFYVNVPFGLLAIVGLWLFLEDGELKPRSRFDWTGFIALSVGLTGLQLMLDRGQLLDWFGSREIIIETVLAGLGFYLFIVHTFLAEKPFLSPRIFLDLNFFAGFLMMFLVGMILLASTALLSPYLQTLANYPIDLAGLVMAPRGAGTMAAMLIAGRLSNRVDARLIMLAGLLIMGWTMYEMSAWTPDVSVSTLVVTTTIQGFGLGLVFIPLQVVAFTTLAAELQTDAAALLSLIRNVGSAIGISVTSFLLTQNTQIVHAQIVESVTPFNRMLQTGGAYLLWNPTGTTGLAALNAEVTRQAQIIAYGDDFKLMLFICLIACPLLLLMRRSPQAPAVKAVAE